MNLFIKILVQTCIAFFTILVLTRILGKQQLAQLTYYEYINGITFGSIAATMATDTDQIMWQHLAGLIFFGVLTYSMSYVSLKSRPLRKIISGEPVIVVQNGKILENNLKKMRYDLDELNSELRYKGIFNIADVEFAIIETSGKFSVLKKTDADALTRRDLEIVAPAEGLQVEVIVDGQMIYANLVNMGLDGKWLLNQLDIKGIKQIKQVAYASIDANHNLYFDLYQDKIAGQIDVSDDAKIPFSLDFLESGQKNKKN
ncbi:MAG: DUF421 domain-containing protein [Peptococcaceae bacterium]